MKRIYQKPSATIATLNFEEHILAYNIPIGPTTCTDHYTHYSDAANTNADEFDCEYGSKVYIHTVGYTGENVITP